MGQRDSDRLTGNTSVASLGHPFPLALPVQLDRGPGQPQGAGQRLDQGPGHLVGCDGGRQPRTQGAQDAHRVAAIAVHQPVDQPLGANPNRR